MSPSTPLLQVYCPGEVDYATALAWQQCRVQRLLSDPEVADGLLLLTHPEIYTLGQGASLEHLRFDPDRDPYALVRVQRGGEVTYHGPGQWVAYPILQLQRHQPDLHWYLRQLEQVVIEILAELGLEGHRIEGLTGVWVQGCKVAAVGIRVTKWVTYHGFALNVDPDLQAFERIVPCGIADRPVGSLVQFYSGSIDSLMRHVETLIPVMVARCFGLQPQVVEREVWLTGAGG